MNKVLTEITPEEFADAGIENSEAAEKGLQGDSSDEQVKASENSQASESFKANENPQKSAATTSGEDAIGKFKNASELLKAYNALEAEFTKKSQMLSEYIKRQEKAADAGDIACGNEATASGGDNAENSAPAAFDAGAQGEVQSNDAQKAADESGGANGENHAEQNGEAPSVDEETFRARVDKFFSENPAARPFAKQIAQEIADGGLTSDENCFDKALLRFLVKSYKSPSQLMESEDFVNDYILPNERIKRLFIEDYLFGLSQNKPPRTIFSAGVTALTPPSRPKTLEEAGWLFVRDNK